MKLDDSYVVRIFRRDARTGKGQRAYDGIALAGIVEHPGSGNQSAFHDVEELWTVLVRPAKTVSKGTRGKRNLPVTRSRRR